ncbi:[citrate (pro-3S)-lyase] ligase [Convivina praedatoris]|uniref:[Citrate [pro-3S]-lyase] ligase n=1 Tax=Convivina praedatoris TaxID=2880963 RepID=A0ABM9D239_9LACO|nr:[citrate (pro-3S)-lyase] ligase [Convivina sp. LMG 32447]CAH1853699.1 [Citrate [pro-3S]-lyase] ligase [Convivina sp. LMG 32447]CAH1854684.1 [Citrate [pro-3S]-lyase] ligase [Convivina sp. LMG 32447]CAH1855157.1 [Citrate [pro-3S]-lyase] ligase [Convivina sp. LMG 32447]
MTAVIRPIYLQQSRLKKVWENFLTARGVDNFVPEELAQIEITLGMYDESENLVGTGSIANEVIKYIAVCDKGSDQKGARFNTLITALLNQMAQWGRFHAFVFTKPEYRVSFEHVGFKSLADSPTGVILERGTPNIDDYLANLPQAPQQAQNIASIVMNANPFTKGHRYLVEQAAQANDFVYVFVVNQDASLFTTQERMDLVIAGCADLSNVVVVNGGDYMVSFLSFPSYFIKNPDQVIGYQTTLDARLFKNNIAPALRIDRRYLGSEPQSHTTNIYNETLQKELPPAVDVIIVPRLAADGNQATVSARDVRQAIAQGNQAGWENLVPATTGQFITGHLAQLQARIEKGQQINGN